MKTLYVTDLDGTLLNKQDTISQKSIKIINDLVEQGMLFTYATARSLVSASVVTKGLSTIIPVIAYNGVSIINPATSEILSSTGFSKEETDNVISVLRKCNVSPFVYSYIDHVESVSWVTSKENDGKKRYLSLKKGDKRLRPLSSDLELYDGNIFYYTCIGEQEELLPVYNAFKDDDRYRCTIQQELYRPEYWCEIMPRNATKAEAIIKLKKLWGCNRVIVFGDAINDIPMFEVSDECYAVANAVPELKKMATGVIGSNEEDAVSEWLKAHAEF
ncbi:MAG: HAD family hydrolase [Lachnospiraceae bacterium]|nr:HAD family hydrolase [Lachnospiraceae bacterium]